MPTELRTGRRGMLSRDRHGVNVYGSESRHTASPACIYPEALCFPLDRPTPIEKGRASKGTFHGRATIALHTSLKRERDQSQIQKKRAGDGDD